MRQLELATIRVPTPTQREYMPEQVQYAIVSRKATEGEMLKDAPGLSTATFELVMDGVLKLEAQVPGAVCGRGERGARCTDSRRRLSGSRLHRQGRADQPDGGS